jgi:hypothetical protein
VGDGRPSGNGSSSGPARDYARPGVKGGAGGGFLGWLRPLDAPQRWGVRNALTGATVTIVEKRNVGGQTEVLVASDGSEWVVQNPAGASGVVPYVP